ncbi:MAG: carbohydrate ABC transporter permease [Micromonosporaceae bacterium]|nr:carbohydrate ABC transporter permease [Micromonosporaceae bacterium]
MALRLQRWALYFCLAAATFYLLAPVVWMLLLSFMTQAEALSTPPHWIPLHPTLSNYAAFVHPDSSGAQFGGAEAAALPQSMLNSVIVALWVAGLNVVLGTMAGYSFARLDFRGRNLLMVSYLVARMIPAVGIMIPLFVVLNKLGLLNHLASLVLTETSETLPFSIWLLAAYFRTIPPDLEHAARVDRCSWSRAMLKVFLPIARPALAAVAVFAFMESWGAFLYPLLFTPGDNTTLPVTVAGFATNVQIDYGLLATAGVLAVIPPFILAFLFQRWIVQGMASGAVTG